MKICLINNLYKPFNRGGAEKITETIAKGLIGAGHQVFIITTKPFGRRSPDNRSGSKIYYLNSWYYHLNKLPKFIRFFWQIWNMFNFINYFKIKIILKKAAGDIVITNNLMGLGFLTPLAIKNLKIKQIHIVHDIQLIHPSGLMCFGQEKIINHLGARNYAGLCSRLFASPKIVIFPSFWLRDRYLDKIFFVKSKRIVLPNPIAFKPAPESEKTGASFKFLYLGQVEKHKGLNLLVQAFKKIKEKFPQSELIIAGEGSELTLVKLQAGEDKSIKFLGWQAEEEVSRLLDSCQTLVMPTLCYENCPTVILEAFSAGLPVIASDLGGITELIGETAGLLFRPGNVADLVDKMQWAIEQGNNLSEIIEAGRAKAASNSVENYIKKLTELAKL